MTDAPNLARLRNEAEYAKANGWASSYMRPEEALWLLEQAALAALWEQNGREIEGDLARQLAALMTEERIRELLAAEAKLAEYERDLGKRDEWEPGYQRTIASLTDKLATAERERDDLLAGRDNNDRDYKALWSHAEALAAALERLLQHRSDLEAEAALRAYRGRQG